MSFSLKENTNGKEEIKRVLKSTWQKSLLKWLPQCQHPGKIKMVFVYEGFWWGNWVRGWQTIFLEAAADRRLHTHYVSTTLLKRYREPLTSTDCTGDWMLKTIYTKLLTSSWALAQFVALLEEDRMRSEIVPAQDYKPKMEEIWEYSLTSAPREFLYC